MLICYSIELKITLIIFNFKKKKIFSYPDNGSNRIFFIRIIIRIETALSGYPKKKNYPGQSGWTRIRIVALCLPVEYLVQINKFNLSVI